MKGELESSTRTVPTWIIFGNETIEMFINMSRDCPTLFTHCSLGERVATMLNYNTSKVGHYLERYDSLLTGACCF